MSPAVIPGLTVWVCSIIGGYRTGKKKGRVGAGLTLTILFGLIGLVILLCLPRSKAMKAAEAQRQDELQAATAGAGYPYTTQQAYAPYPQPGQGTYAPQQPYQPYPAPGQGSYPQQPYQPYPQQPYAPYPTQGQYWPPGQYSQSPPPGQWQEPPPGQRQQPPWEQ